MSETWEADSDPVNRIEVGDAVETVEGEVSADRVQEVARNNGVKKFKVEDENGNGLDMSDFPVNRNVRVSEYNENA